MASITIEVPDDVFAALRRSPQEFAREMRLAAAIQWYSQGLISQDKAAEITGLDRIDFLFALAHARVDAFQVSPEELKEEVELGLQARRERLAAHRPDAGEFTTEDTEDTEGKRVKRGERESVIRSWPAPEFRCHALRDGLPRWAHRMISPLRAPRVLRGETSSFS